MIKLPSIEITFKQLAGTMIERSQRGIAILIVKDDTDATMTFTEYASITDAEKDADKYTAGNMQYIRDIFGFALNRVCVARIGTAEGTITEALAIVENNVKTGWVTVADGTTEDFEALATWTKSKENERKTYKTVCYKVATPDCKHIVNFYNDKVTFADDRQEQTGAAYCPSLIGILASCNVRRGVTYYKCPNLIKTKAVINSETAVEGGQFILINDDNTVKIALGINSMTTTDGTTATEDMRYIDTVEVMDLVSDDISRVFKNEYIGSYKNNYDNQILLISAINTYFKRLAEDDILDNHYPNRSDVDVSAQRQAWIDVGKTEAETWDDHKVKDNAFKRTVFLAADIRILGSMENLKFTVNLE